MTATARVGSIIALLALPVAVGVSACKPATTGAPVITASPNPVPSGPGGTGTTVIAWNAGPGRPGPVKLSGGREEALFARALIHN
jgi:hypothetical protein